MLLHKATQRYTKALFELALEAKSLHKVATDLGMIGTLIRESKDLRRFLHNPEIPSSLRRSAFAALFEKRVDPLTLRFLNFLEHKDRLILLEEIISNFEEFYLEHENYLKVRVESARKLEAKHVKQIADRLKERLKKDILSDVSEDPNLIGGFKIQVKDWIQDFSLRAQLLRFKTRILQG